LQRQEQAAGHFTCACGRECGNRFNLVTHQAVCRVLPRAVEPAVVLLEPFPRAPVEAEAAAEEAEAVEDLPHELADPNPVIVPNDNDRQVIIIGDSDEEEIDEPVWEEYSLAHSDSSGNLSQVLDLSVADLEQVIPLRRARWQRLAGRRFASDAVQAGDHPPPPAAAPEEDPIPLAASSPRR